MSNKLEATFHPSTCGAEHKCVSPDAPPHICTQPLGHFPATPHQGFTEFTWTAPEGRHLVVVP